MIKGTLLTDITNTILDQNITVAHKGEVITVLEDLGSYYKAICYGGDNPTTVFYVSTDQVSLHNEH